MNSDYSTSRFRAFSTVAATNRKWSSGAVPAVFDAGIDGVNIGQTYAIEKNTLDHYFPSADNHDGIRSISTVPASFALSNDIF